MRVATGLPYYGGKARLGKWINQFLPWKWDQIYVEPYGGMAGVLHNREPVKIEIINDLNDRVINWWRVVRDHTDELIHLVRNTPSSRSEFVNSINNLDNLKLDDVKRALYYQIVVHQSMIKGDGHPTWVLSFQQEYNKQWKDPQRRIELLADRMRLVQLESRDALEVLDRTKRFEKSVIYVDPPYISADRAAYRKSCRDIDVSSLTAILLRQRGKVAISGYNDEWDHLDWVCLEKQVTFSGTHTADHANAEASRRVEKLWVNW